MIKWLPSFLFSSRDVSARKRSAPEKEEESAPLAFAPTEILMDDGPDVYEHAAIYNTVPRDAVTMSLVSARAVLGVRCILLQTLLGGHDDALIFTDETSYINIYGDVVSLTEARAFTAEDDPGRLRPALVMNSFIKAEGYDTQQFVYPLLLWTGGFSTAEDDEEDGGAVPLADWASACIAYLSLMAPIDMQVFSLDHPRVQSRMLMHAMTVRARASSRIPRIVPDGGELVLMKRTIEGPLYLTLDGTWLPLRDARDVGIATSVIGGALTAQDDEHPDVRFALEVDAILHGSRHFWTRNSLARLGGGRGLSSSLGLSPSEAARILRG